VADAAEAAAAATLITGAHGGIGRALCEAFALAGYRVIATDNAATSEAHEDYIPLDLAALPRNPEVQQDFLQDLSQVLGDSPLKVCVNNAAVQVLGHLEDLSDQGFQHTLDVNLFSPMVLARLLLPMLEAAQGSIINIGSIHARATKPGFVAYATSKAALHGLTQALAVDLGGRVRVNTIQPAAVATPMLKAGFADNPEGYAELARFHPVQRIAEPAEIARVAVLLASDHAGFISGTAVDMHGGIGVRLHDPD
jgi:NAD(P)-dependent dehydrogenase (short-subunit alcohol dehydrogenase family)